MINPVFRREINTMFRSFKTFIAIGAYGLAMLGITALILFNVLLAYNRFNGFDPQTTIQLFCCMFALQTAIVFLAVPGFSAGSISGERERQTLDLMLLTKMSPLTIVIGKLLSSLLLICIMLIAALPVYAIVFYYGGISIVDLLVVCFFDITYAMAIGSVSIFLSSVFKKTVTSTVLSYIILIFYPVIITILTYILASFYYFNNVGPVPVSLKYLIMGANPFGAFLSVIEGFLGIDYTGDILNNSDYNSEHFKIWHLAVLFNFVVSFFFIRFSAKVINPIYIKKQNNSKPNKKNENLG